MIGRDGGLEPECDSLEKDNSGESFDEVEDDAFADEPENEEDKEVRDGLNDFGERFVSDKLERC